MLHLGLDHDKALRKSSVSASLGTNEASDTFIAPCCVVEVVQTDAASF